MTHWPENEWRFRRDRPAVFCFRPNGPRIEQGEESLTNRSSARRRVGSEEGSSIFRALSSKPRAISCWAGIGGNKCASPALSSRQNCARSRVYANLIKRYTHWLHTRWPAGVVEKLPESGEFGVDQHSRGPNRGRPDRHSAAQVFLQDRRGSGARDSGRARFCQGRRRKAKAKFSTLPSSGAASRASRPRSRRRKRV